VLGPVGNAFRGQENQNSVTPALYGALTLSAGGP
jgi:hypothetical protein